MNNTTARYQLNRKILRILEDFLEKNPDLRFQQALHALHIVGNDDNFYEESSETLQNLQKRLDEVLPLDNPYKQLLIKRKISLREIISFIRSEIPSKSFTPEGIEHYLTTRNKRLVICELGMLLAASEILLESEEKSVMRGKETILAVIKNKENNYLRQVYSELTARKYFEEYTWSTAKAAEDIGKAFALELQEGILHNSDLEELIEEHLSNIDDVAFSRQDWGCFN